MALDRVTFDLTLTVLSPLHIGDGQARPLETLRSEHAHLRRLREAGEPTGAGVATVVRDNTDRPCLPATAVKGLLSALEENQDRRDELFGTIKDTVWTRDGGGHEVPVDHGRMGRLHLRLARAGWPIAVPDDLPFADTGHGTYIDTRVAIDRQTGTADRGQPDRSDDGKLFSQELVPPGARFIVHATYHGTRARFEETVSPLLAHLRRREGLPLGKGGAKGQGAVRLDAETVTATVHGFDTAAFRMVAEKVTLTLPEAAGAATTGETLHLFCKGPFLPIDPTRGGSAKDGKAQLAAYRRGGGEPVLRGTGLIGALRARCAWLAELASPASGDDPWRRPDDWSSPDDLTPTERLFGVTGWRGLVRVVAIGAPTGVPVRSLTSVSLDRFTGGPIDGALFSSEAFVGCGFTVGLALDERRQPSRDDRTLFGDLIDDIKEHGLRLGSGTTKGFGWFTVKGPPHG